MDLPISRRLGSRLSSSLTMAPARRPALLPTAVALVALCAAGRFALSFVPARTAPTQLRSTVARHASMRDSEGNKVREPKTFDASDASQVVSSVTVEYKKRPFGVLAYAPSTSGKGAMILKMSEQSRNQALPSRSQPWQVMFTILALKVWQPNGVGMNRGNHEAEAWAKTPPMAEE
eukprot:Skav228003  [mRNA]  locus=scaffold390:445098:456410:- [translate_table: standard]